MPSLKASNIALYLLLHLLDDAHGAVSEDSIPKQECGSTGPQMK